MCDSRVEISNLRAPREIPTRDRQLSQRVITTQNVNDSDRLRNEIIMNVEGIIVYFKVMLSISKLTKITSGDPCFYYHRVNMIIKKENTNTIVSASNLKSVAVINPRTLCLPPTPPPPDTTQHQISLDELDGTPS